MTSVIAKIGRSKYRTELIAGGHAIIADEPHPVGTNEGPYPYDYLLSALGSCVAITIRMYADRKEWPLEGVEVYLSQEKVKAEECEECSSTKGFVQIIEKKIKLIGDLTDDQRARLLDISDKCPVNRTLLSEIRINNSLIN